MRSLYGLKEVSQIARTSPYWEIRAPFIKLAPRFAKFILKIRRFHRAHVSDLSNDRDGRLMSCVDRLTFINIVYHLQISSPFSPRFFLSEWEPLIGDMDDSTLSSGEVLRIQEYTYLDTLQPKADRLSLAPQMNIGKAKLNIAAVVPPMIATMSIRFDGSM